MRDVFAFCIPQTKRSLRGHEVAANISDLNYISTVKHTSNVECP